MLCYEDPKGLADLVHAHNFTPKEIYNQVSEQLNNDFSS
jgi:hypothetical protein